jgi:hypothetical protein
MKTSGLEVTVGHVRSSRQFSSWANRKHSYLCGSPAHTCSSGDWRQAYANFLVKYVQLYAAAGLPITHLGFLNEPDYEVSYSQMQISNNAAEAIDFIRVLAATVKAAGRTTKVLASQPLGLHPTIKPGLKRANDAWLLAHVL